MTRYIGIARGAGDPGYLIIIMLFNMMVKITPWTPRTKGPRYYWYDKEAFNYYTNGEYKSDLAWFFGLKIN